MLIGLRRQAVAGDCRSIPAREQIKCHFGRRLGHVLERQIVTAIMGSPSQLVSIEGVGVCSATEAERSRFQNRFALGFILAEVDLNAAAIGRGSQLILGHSEGPAPISSSPAASTVIAVMRPSAPTRMLNIAEVLPFDSNHMLTDQASREPTAIESFRIA
jgi:hypothetical protein